jgi:hypothetical protein
VYLLNAPMTLDSDATIRHQSSVFMQVYINDQDNNTRYREYGNPPTQFKFNPLVKLPPEYKVGFFNVNNHPTEDVTLHYAYTVIDPRPDD